MPPRAPPLPLSEIVAQAFRLPWERRGDFIRALALPALAIAAIRLGWWLAGDQLGSALSWAAWAAHGAAWVLFAVACHRLVLLDLRGDDVPRVPGWGRPETVFLLAALLACATVMLAGMAALLPVALIVSIVSDSLWETISHPLGAVLGTYVFARMAPVLPAAAIGARVNLPEMWRRTRGNGWRLAFVVGVLPWALAYVSSVWGGDDPGIVVGIVTTALSVALMAVEISALSIAYRLLTAER
jgi:hypothetical protein